MKSEKLNASKLYYIEYCECQSNVVRKKVLCAHHSEFYIEIKECCCCGRLIASRIFTQATE